MSKCFKLFITIVVGIAVVFITSGIYAGTKVQDTVRMENKAYSKHKKGIVQFSHEKHSTDYPNKYSKIYSSNCGECHHDANNKPLKSLKKGDNVQNCIECHKKPGRKPKAKKGQPKLTKKEKLQYHAEALHGNCKDCHKAFNRKYKPKKKAPLGCKCHQK